MSEYLKRVHKRLVARAMRADEDKWITINGTHVLVGEGGDIKKGPDGLKEEHSWKDTAKRAKKNKAKAKAVSLSKKAEVFNHLVDDDYKARERRERENEILNDVPKRLKITANASGDKPVDVSKFKFKDYRNPDGQRTPGYETYRKALSTMSAETEKVKGRVLKNYSGEMPPAEQARIEFKNLVGHSAYRDISSPVAEQGINDADAAIRKRQKQIVESLKPYTAWNNSKKEWEIPKK